MQAGLHGQCDAVPVFPGPAILAYPHLHPQVEHGAAVEMECGPVVIVRVELPLVVRPHVPDRPPFIRLEPAPPEQATAAS